MIRLFKLFFSLFLLVVLLVVADRLAARVAGRVVADRIKASQHLSATPAVSVLGFPFLTQLVRGTYDHVDVAAVDLNRQAVHASRLDLQLYGVRVPVADLLSQSLTSIPVARGTGTVQLSYADINALTKTTGVKVSPGKNGAVTVTGSVTLAGRTVKGSGTGSVEATRDGIRFTVATIRAAGTTPALAALLRTKLSFLIPNTRLPFGVKVHTVDAGPAGVHVGAAVGAFTIPAR